MKAERPQRSRARRRSAPLERRELELSRDIAEAFFHAQSPVEVYRLALTRVTPLVNASFSSVFLRDAQEPDLLRLICAMNWPQRSARFLSQIRIRVGRGPTGRAVAERRAIEIEDLFGDPGVRDWWEPARELGFASLISLPLYDRDVAIGAVTFYFAEPHDFTDDERRLLDLIATQLSITVERASQVQALRQENEGLKARVAELDVRIGEAEGLKRLKNEFLSNISHELRTPLTAILGHTYLLKQQNNGNLDEAQVNGLGKIDHAATLLLRLINDLLELTELKLGRVEVANALTDAAALARHARQRAPAVAKGVTFRVDVEADPIPVRTDAEKVIRILDNLISNACKFTRAGEIVLSVAQRRTGNTTRVEWSVRDTGIGIPAAEQAAIFDEFRQVDGSSTRLYGGTGLGLALSLRIAELLGGELLVESRQGVGSTFTLQLPAEPRAAQPASIHLVS